LGADRHGALPHCQRLRPAHGHERAEWRQHQLDDRHLPATISHVSGSESYSYDTDGERIKKVAGSVTTVYLAGLWEEVVGGAAKAYYTFNGQTAALYTSSPSAFTYLTNDHLGSVSVATNGLQAKTQQEYDPWGKVRSGGITQTSINFTGQRLDGSGLLYYHGGFCRTPNRVKQTIPDTFLPIPRAQSRCWRSGAAPLRPSPGQLAPPGS
jgi:hypothetical protein